MTQAAQRIASDPKLSVFVTANAGSGKTTTLVSRVARLLRRGADPAAILCVTYTKAAAAEMQTRLFQRLGGWAVAEDDKLRAELADLEGLSPAIFTDEDLSRARRLFARALETPGGLKIQTIHAFCEKLLRRFPIEAGVSPRFKVLEDAAAVALSHQAREDLAREAWRDPEGRLGQVFSHFAVQLDWGRFQDLLALIEARRLELTDYLDRIEAGTAPGPHELCGVDPDVSAETLEGDFLAFIEAREWAATAEAMQTGSVNDQKIAACMRQASPPDCTFDALGPVFLKADGDPKSSMGTKNAPPAAVAWLADLQLKYLAARDRIRSARVAEDTQRLLTLTRAHAAFYELAKARTGALDFTDLVDRAARLLSGDESQARWVLYKLDGGIDHVLVDEAQDTAPEQWAILQALTAEFFTHEDSRRSVFAVGDEKQSIYSFQGARPEQLRIQGRLYGERAGDRFRQAPLEASYRSTPEVLAFVDAVFDDPERARALTGPEGDIQPHVAVRQGQHGGVEMVPLFIDEAAPERDAWTDPVDQESRQSARKRLANRLAQDIRRQVETCVAVHDREGRLRPCGYGDFLILVRRRDALFEEVIRALKLAGVPVAGADRLKLAQHIAFDDLLSLVRFALFPDDDLSLAEVLRSPFCDVDEASLFALAGAEKRKRSLWRELKARAGERPEWGHARALLDFALASRGGDPFVFFSGVLNRVDERGMSGRARVLKRLGREAEEALDETLNQVMAAEARGGLDLETCLHLLEQADVEVKRELEGPRGEVRVMTVHGAKGLEAPIVILPDTTMRAKAQGPTVLPVEGEFEGRAWLMCPGSGKEDCPVSADARLAGETRTRDETLRLLYVALTRARDRLVVMGRVNSRGKAEDGSWWSAIEETFGRLDGVETLDDGVRRYGAAPVVALRTGEDEAAPAPAPHPDWAGRPAPPDAGARFASPSRMDETLRIPAPSPLARSGSLGRFRRGDLIHRLLERLPDMAEADRREGARRLMARERDLSEDQRAEMIEAAFQVLDDPRFAAVFGPGSRAEVALTGRAPELPPGVSISGRIDRLVVRPERVLIIDYKTNRPPPADIAAVDPAYVTQLAIYAAVLRRLYPDRPVEAALIWTDGPSLMPIPRPLLDRALAG